MSPKFFALDENDRQVEVPFSELTREEAYRFICILVDTHQTELKRAKALRRWLFVFGFFAGWLTMGLFALYQIVNVCM